MTLEAISADKAGLLSNLLNLYMHDMSEIFPVEPGVDGVFRYEKLSRYWSAPERHFAFLIHVGGRVAGFALATRGSPATEDAEHLDVAEFFILRSHRRSGVGREAAFALWNRLRGQWVVRVSKRNLSGVSFWRSAIKGYTQGAFAESQRAGSPHDWLVFTFANVDGQE